MTMPKDLPEAVAMLRSHDTHAVIDALSWLIGDNMSRAQGLGCFSLAVAQYLRTGGTRENLITMVTTIYDTLGSQAVRA